MAHTPYPDAIDKRRAQVLFADGRYSLWLYLLLIATVVGCPGVIMAPILRLVYGGVWVRGQLYLTPDKIAFSASKLDRLFCRVQNGTLDLEIPLETVTHIDRNGWMAILTTRNGKFKITPLKAKEYVALLAEKTS